MPSLLPNIVLVGRPNVGKSTLFNRLIRSNRAITHDRPGVTRDRMEGVVRRPGKPEYGIIDTGGITLDDRLIASLTRDWWRHNDRNEHYKESPIVF